MVTNNYAIIKGSSGATNGAFIEKPDYRIIEAFSGAFIEAFNCIFHGTNGAFIERYNYTIINHYVVLYYGTL